MIRTILSALYQLASDGTFTRRDYKSFIISDHVVDSQKGKRTMSSKFVQSFKQ